MAMNDREKWEFLRRVVERMERSHLIMAEGESRDSTSAAYERHIACSYRIVLDLMRECDEGKHD